MSASPGMTAPPAASTIAAPSGTATCAPGPAAMIRLPSTTTTPSAIGAPPIPSMMVALVTATAPGDAASFTGAGAQAVARTMRVAAARMLAPPTTADA